MRKENNQNAEKKAFWLGLGLAAGLAGAVAIKRQRKERARAWHSKMAYALPRTALVTGASSGIGEAYARRLASQGYQLVLVARRKDRLEKLAGELSGYYGACAEIIPADLSTEAGIARVEKRIKLNEDIDFLVNSAGYDVFGPFAETPIEKTLALINCLELACVRLTRAVLPGMLERKCGAVVNVSSIGAFGPKPKDSTYVASKAYLNAFSESLAMELAASGVRVQALCPGFTLTGFHDAPEYAQYHIKENIPAWMWMKPEQVVNDSLQALAEDRPICIPGLMYKLVAFNGRLGLTSLSLKILASFFPPQDRPALLARELPLDRLACPHCHGDLHLQGDPQDGSLSCQRCHATYPVSNGIPRFIHYEELSGNNRRFAGLYDWFSYVYALYSRVAFAFLGGEARNRRELVRRLGEGYNRVLEVSIGPGVNLPYLLEQPWVREVDGLDISTGQLIQCRRFAGRKGYPVNLALGNAEELPYQDNSYDAVLHMGGINFFNDRQKAICEMIRVAKPGAKVVIADEMEKGAKAYDMTLPGFRRSFKSGRTPVLPPMEFIPPDMIDVRLDDSFWGGWFYCIEFRKPKAG